MEVHAIGPHYLAHGDCIEVMRLLPDNSIDACVSDPPYGLGFMGKHWDGEVPGVDFARELLRVLKPGAHACLFGGTRTYHRLTVALEDEGFEIRDCLSWLYGTGFPKSLDISKAIALAGGVSPVEQAQNLKHQRMALGLSREDVASAVGCTVSSVRDWEDGRARRDGGALEFMVPSERYRARLSDLFAYTRDTRELANSVTPRSGDGSVIGLGHAGQLRTSGNTDAARQWEGWGTALKPAWEPIILARKPLIGTVAANVQAHGTGGLNIDACRIEGAPGVPGSSGYKGAESNVLGKGWNATASRRAAAYIANPPSGRWPANMCLDEVAAAMLDEQSGTLKSGVKNGGQYGRSSGVHEGGQRVDGTARGADTGGASRFFYTAKPSRAERDLGCDHLPARTGGEATDREDGAPGATNPRSGAGRTGGARNIHPTVKPAALIRWLLQLVTPPGGCVLDPFVGSGTIYVAAKGLDLSVAGIEREAEYITIALARGLASV